MPVPTTGRFAAEQCENLFFDVTAQIARTIHSGGIDEVHDLRVAIRRFRHILSVMKPCFPGTETKRLRRRLKGIMIQAGRVRDHDAAIRLVGKMAESEPEPDGLREIGQELRDRRNQAARTLAVLLARWERLPSHAGWHPAAESAKSPRPADARFCATSAAAAASSILPAAAKEHFRRGKKATHGSPPARDLHRFRIRVKKLRYTLDFFAPLYGGSLKGLVVRLKDMQTLLGDIQDCVIVRRIVSGLSGNPVKKDILSALKKRQRRKTGEFRQEFGCDFSGDAVSRHWEMRLKRIAPHSPPAPHGVAKKSQIGSRPAA